MHTILDTSFRPHSDSIVDYLCPRQTVLSRETSSSVTCASVACPGFAHSLLATKNAPGRSEGIWPAKYTGMEQLQTEAKKFDASAPDVDVETTYDCIPPAQNFNGGVWFLEYVVPTWMAKIKFEAAAAAVTIVRLLRDNKHLKEGHADHAMAKISLDLSSTFQDEPVRLLLDELRRSLGKMPMRKRPEIYRNLISTMTVGPARPEEERERRIDIAYTFKYKFPVGVDGSSRQLSRNAHLLNTPLQVLEILVKQFMHRCRALGPQKSHTLLTPRRSSNPVMSGRRRRS